MDVKRMCGIIGVKAVEKAQQIVFSGLKKLEYRGYDSWGIAISDEENFANVSSLPISIVKRVGAIGEAELKFVKCGLAIGHTRWATHGVVNEKNCHPHKSNDGTVAVVHNGIIDNYLKLKESLTCDGYIFESKTDTEVIPNIIQKKMIEGLSFKKAFRATIEELDGSYAILALNKNEICFAKKDSPLIIGFNNESIQISSDVNAFSGIEELKYLDDGDWGVITDAVKIFDETGAEVEKESKKYKIKPQIKNINHKHHMLAEIYEQPRIIMKDPVSVLSDARKQLNSEEQAYLMGCGTSYHACMAGEYFLCAKGINATAILASEHKRKLNFIQGTLIIISQSGETADLIEAVKNIKKIQKIQKNKNVKIIGIVNNEHSTLARMSDVLIPMGAGKEIAVASTKAFTCAIKILHDLVFESGVSEKIKLNEAQINEWHQKAKTIVEKISKKRDIFLIGRNEEFAYALEGALKIKEVSYLRAEGLAGGELKHGTLALIEEGTPVFCISGKNRQEIINNAQEIKARGGYIIGIDTEKHEVYDEFISCSHSLLSSIPLQLIAYELSIGRGINPDKPRNLAKSVTVK